MRPDYPLLDPKFEIHRVIRLPSDNSDQFVWLRINRFKNVDYTADVLRDFHKAAKKNMKRNLRKQSIQIKYCIEQAKEYMDAAGTVSYSTKPLLLYYSCMSLALCEILFKQTGESSLDKARSENRHHGMSLKIRPYQSEVVSVSKGLVADPVFIDGKYSGTFHLWRQSAVFAPLVGKREFDFRDGTTRSGPDVNLMPVAVADVVNFPRAGVTLFDCFRNTPSITEFLSELGIVPNFVRGRIRRRITIRDDSFSDEEFELVIHPTAEEIVDKISKSIVMHPENVNYIEFYGIRNDSIMFKLKNPENIDLEPMRFPEGVNINLDDVLFVVESVHENEFGYIYLGLFILGTFARYYPDLWMKEIETNSDFFVLASAFLDQAQRRLPILTAAELNRAVYLPG